ncbi:MAG TPA: endonuclease domain-containing protein [Daejeonella sp.]|nr:endonuclease domain-containing protein [Daejeonella sp.]
MPQAIELSETSNRGNAPNSPLLEGCPQGGVVNKFVINNTIIVQKPTLDLPYNPRLKEKAKTLRKARNLPEVLFWMQVSKRKFHKIDFDRQRVIGNYIVDFYVKKLGLVIEIDGVSHDHKVACDKVRRDAYLRNLGINVYRIPVGDVMKSMDRVMMGLENYIIEKYGVKDEL